MKTSESHIYSVLNIWYAPSYSHNSSAVLNWSYIASKYPKFNINSDEIMDSDISNLVF